ncbi:MAG: hypothetical protein AVDCRST_MAG27-691, partial [uncultured Craurococcus sp.]
GRADAGAANESPAGDRRRASGDGRAGRRRRSPARLPAGLHRWHPADVEERDRQPRRAAGSRRGL